jgi:hypothetical protein
MFGPNRSEQIMFTSDSREVENCHAFCFTLQEITKDVDLQLEGELRIGLMAL